jgi:hypothetical protein
MAESPSHRFGQIVGGFLEEILESTLRSFCEPSGLFLDKHGARLGVRKGKKVRWEDKYGNHHDLDFVIEKSAAPSKKGRPIAFIEAAWRRYTKHSKNKAQEIQGAVTPLAETHSLDAPFLGAVLAGEFTAPSLDQLRSHGFHVVHLPYLAVVDAFRKVGIDARFDESTPDRLFARCVAQIETLSEADRHRVKDAIMASGADQLDGFLASLKRKIDRQIEQVMVVPLFGAVNDFDTAGGAASFIESYSPKPEGGSFQRFEIIVRFSNGDRVEGSFASHGDALNFLTYVAG